MALFGVSLPTWFKDALKELAAAVDANTGAVYTHADATRTQTAAINRNTRALEALVRAIAPKKATAFVLTVEPEPPGSLLRKQEQPAMIKSFPLGTGFKATLIFNGVIDEEPRITNTGPGSMTQDLSVEEQNPEFPDDPAKKLTKTVLHFRSSADDSQGIVGISGAVKADDLATTEEEDVIIEVPAVAAFVDPAAKATAFTIETEAEAV